MVHIHSGSATSWDFSTGWYGNYVNQDVVNNMVDAGLKQLTGQSTVAAAWQALLPGYSAGRAVAIKVNFNNCGGCGDSDNIIDGLPQPVIALIRGMTAEMGVQEQDIWIYDALRPLPDRFRTPCLNLYPKVRFFDVAFSNTSGTCSELAAFRSNDPNAQVHFGNSNLTARRITDVVINATYLINMPIMKDHGISGVTLGFKNHFGSLQQVCRAGADNLHFYIDQAESTYNPNYSPMVDIYSNPHIRNKTVLTVGDGLYGALWNTNLPPSRWSTFGNDAPNSLFFSVDPVAIDCVMLDFLDLEPDMPSRRHGEHVDDYLELAAGAGLGVFERGNPWGSGYANVNYQKIEL